MEAPDLQKEDAHRDEAHGDLAFLKTLVSQAPKAQVTAGQVFAVAGAAYSAQCFLYWLQIVFGWQWPGWLNVMVAVTPIAILVGFIGWVFWRDRNEASQGVATRALNSAFASAGLANLALCVVFGYVSATQQNFLIWLLYPPVSCAALGACWYVAFMVRRKLWLLGVAFGWWATAMALGFLIRNMGGYLLLLSVALLVLMVVPGLIMARSGKADEVGEPSADGAHKDLAFLKALVTEGPKAQRGAGQLFFIAGVLYGLQCFGFWVPIAFRLTWPEVAFMFVGFAPTALFLGAMFWMMWRDRKDSMHGAATRAINGAFASAGLANLSMCVALGYVSASEKNQLIWMLYPAVVSAFQGACWYVAFVVRRKLWLSAVSAGWFLTAVTMGFLIRDLGNYLFVFGFALFVLMAAPGYVMSRAGKGG
ncbi:hypothetical protein [Asticcacaulis sp. AC402]|uniref:hypothetical protein n=1 Tax=Asticcacaulis sp. AC402 TaxID=1282361 RepID=UPI0003C3B20A|nr:hypothetical protein [Asticcacaulis sp. AC402]ESQ77216.1 hypothetical protein ABAC402_02095 [Asticcacaulis sp. AC402]